MSRAGDDLIIDDESLSADLEEEAGGLEFVVADEESGRRLDQVLAARFPEFSRSQLARMAKGGQVLVDRRAAKASATAVAGQKVVLPAPQAPVTDLAPDPDVVLDVVYEDADILAVNKPWGLVVHPGSGHYGPTLAGGLLARDPRISAVGEKFRPGLVHRLDKDTSGILITAKTEAALRRLSESFSQRETKKCYLAFIKGRPPLRQGLIDSPIGRHPTQRHKMAVVPGGREARTVYRLLRYFPQADISLLHLRLITGRTHQIRVHLQSLGIPVLADPVYSRGTGDLAARYPQLAPYLNHQLLHARRLTIGHPSTGFPITLHAPWPAEFVGLLNELMLM
ncbi:RluA family pseudouridine synthase [Deltaproteobacteria bacterium Smac51]|nr:RluA family pseudouridine synthase [Deltaproteobacteria bacterium Smac51]